MIKKTIKLAVTSLLFVTFANAGDSYATVNGESITKDDIAQVMGPQASQFDKLDKNMKKRVLDTLVEKKLLIQNASKSGLENSDAYKKKLEIVKKELLLTTWMEEEAKKIEASIKDSDLKAFYDKNRDKFKEPAQLKARHILVKSEDEAKAIIKELEGAKDVNAKFIELAKSKSTGPSGQNGGELGWFPLERMVPEFSSAADKLKKGEFTKTPVKTQFGYHVILLEDRKPAGVKSFDEVKPQIKAILNRKKFNDFIENKVKALKKDAKIEIK